VTPGIQTVKGIDLQAAAAPRLREALAGQDADVTVTGPMADLQVPTSDTDPVIIVPPISGSTFPGLRSVPVEVWLDGKLYRTMNVTFQVSIWQRRAVLARAVNAGEPLHAGLFQIKRVAVDAAQGMQALDTNALAGAVALRALPAGISISERDVHREVVVRRGDTVNVRVIKGHVEVSDIGIARANGRMGERLTVVIQSTGRELTAVVKGPQAVEVRIQ
jgi:flagella basal body P-ring formation protein FlgA